MSKGERKTAIEFRGFWDTVKMFLAVAVISWLVSWGLTRIGNVDLLIWNWLVAVHLANLWLFVLEGTLICIFGYGAYWVYKKNKQEKKQRREFQDRLGQLEF